jgi:hypothetical protein
MVRVEDPDPLPESVTEIGLKVPDRPDTERLTVPEYAPEAVTVTL